MLEKLAMWGEARSQCASAILVGVLVFIICMIRLVWLVILPDIELIKFVPDDAFYYLILAKNFALEQRWTFDGYAPASGFHLLWAYLLAGVYFVFPHIDWQSMFIVAGVAGSIAFSAAAYFVTVIVIRLAGGAAIYGVFFVFFGSASIIQPALMMETPFAMFFAAALFFIVFCSGPLVGGRLMLLGASIGIMGMLSRSDFGLLPLVMFCVAAFVVRDSGKARLALSALLGAIIGLIIVVAHTYWLSGELAPASAQMKNHWAQVDGMSFKPGYEILLALVLPFLKAGQWEWQAQFGTLLLLACLGVALYVSLIHHNRKDILGVYVSAGVVIVGYLLFYRHNGALQVWYAGAFLVPFSILTGISLSVAGRRWPVPVACMVFGVAAYSLSLSMKAPWQWQSSMLRGGIYLKEHPVDGQVGAWNAGIISYFSQQPIVNLDGLVNDDVLEYAKTGRLSDYVALRRIDYIMDFPIMLSGFFSESHGYGDGKLLACMSQEYVIPASTAAGEFGGKLTLYRIRGGCLR